LVVSRFVIDASLLVPVLAKKRRTNELAEQTRKVLKTGHLLGW